MRVRAVLAGLLAALSCGCKADPGSVWRQATVPSAQLGWEPAPNTAVTNSRGMLGPELADLPAAGTTRVLVLGDSFLENPALPGALAAAAAARGLKAEFALGGMRGYSPDQYLLWYRLHGRRLGARRVFVFWFAGNDLAGLVKSRFNEGYQKPYFVLTDGRLVPGNQPLAEPERRFASDAFTPTVRAEWAGFLAAERALADRGGSAGPGGVRGALYRAHHALYARFTAYRILKDGAVNLLSSRDPARQAAQLALGDLWHLRNTAYAFHSRGEDLERAWALNEAVLRELHADVRREGATLTLCLVPSVWQVDAAAGERAAAAAAAAGYAVDLEAPRRRLAAAARRLGVPFVDLTAPLREAQAARPAYDSTGASAHWSAAGVEAAARAVAESLSRLP